MNNLITIILFLLSIISGMLSWFLILLYKKYSHVNEDLNHTKLNYIDRFGLVNSKLEAIHIDIALIKNNCQLHNSRENNVNA